MRYHPHTRRMFLRGAGGALLGVPLLPSLLPKSLRNEALAQTTPPRRFVAIKTYSGCPVRAFYPGSQPGYQTHNGDGRVRVTQPLREPTGRHSNGNEYFGHFAPLSDFAENGISQVFGTAFNRHHPKMLLFRGLDVMPGLNHNHGAFLGNFGLRTNGTGGVLPGAQINVTIDHVMAASSAVYSTAPSGPRILHLGSRTNTCSYAPSNPNELLATGLGAIQQAQAYTDPRAAFEAALGQVMMPGDGPVSPSVRLVDRVLADYQRARGGPHLSNQDRQKLEQHMTRLEELEARLSAQRPVTTCNPGAGPVAIDTGGEFNTDPNEVTQLFESFVDVLTLAFACDVTRIATLDVTKMVINDNGTVFGMGDSENANSAGRENWHYQAHTWDANAQRWLSLGAQWVAEAVILRLIDQLDATEQSDGQTLLDHSLVMWSNELSFNHLNYSLPTAVWGRAGGFLNPGRYIDYINHDRPVRFRQHDGPVIEGVQYNRFVVTMLQAMGLSPSEYEASPGASFGETHHVEKDGAWAIDYDQSRVAQVLPDV